MADPEITVDARGLYCPIPILRLAKAFRSAPSGTVGLLLATDPAAVADVETFCRETGHALLDWKEDSALFTFLVRKS